MGLDMYMYARKHEANYNRYDEKELRVPEYPQELKDCALPVEDYGIYTSTDYAVGYWRKANAIHGYFVEKVAEGVDECQELVIPLEVLEDLKDRCEKVLDNHMLAQELLPPSSGFFFGGLQLDDWYFNSLEKTVNIITPLIKLLQEHPHEWQVIYQASW